MNGQNHIVVMTPMKFLPAKDFEKRQKSIDQNTTLALMSSLARVDQVIENKKKALELKEKGNILFKKKKYDEAEKIYSEGLRLNMNSRQLWTNRAICRNTMKKFEDALSDCDSALSINPKCTKSIIQKGNALLGLNRFDTARECYESLRPLGEVSLAETYLKKLHDAQDRGFCYEFHSVEQFYSVTSFSEFPPDSIKFLETNPSKFPKPAINSGPTSNQNNKKTKARFEYVVFANVHFALMV